MAEGRKPGWVTDHIRRYLASNGEDGHIWNGVPTLLLTTRGRRSGEQRTTPLIYGKVAGADRYLIVASRGGARHHPSWYLNLVETPAVQLGSEQTCSRPAPAPRQPKKSPRCGI